MISWFKKVFGGEDAPSSSPPRAPSPSGPLARVTFEDDDVTVEVAQGTPLPDVCDDHDLSLAYGCRAGGCGTCLIEVLDDGSGLKPADDLEKEICEVLTDHHPRARLACQSVVIGDVRFRAFPI